jgi:signal transduction histidine kinase
LATGSIEVPLHAIPDPMVDTNSDVTVRIGRGAGSALVQNDGHGVSPDERESIFEPYRRAHDAPGLTASMGLGLAISRELARLMVKISPMRGSPA